MIGTQELSECTVILTFDKSGKCLTIFLPYSADKNGPSEINLSVSIRAKVPVRFVLSTMTGKKNNEVYITSALTLVHALKIAKTM